MPKDESVDWVFRGFMIALAIGVLAALIHGVYELGKVAGK